MEVTITSILLIVFLVFIVFFLAILVLVLILRKDALVKIERKYDIKAIAQKITQSSPDDAFLITYEEATPEEISRIKDEFQSHGFYNVLITNRKPEIIKTKVDVDAGNKDSQ